MRINDETVRRCWNFAVERCSKIEIPKLKLPSVTRVSHLGWKLEGFGTTHPWDACFEARWDEDAALSVNVRVPVTKKTIIFEPKLATTMCSWGPCTSVLIDWSSGIACCVHTLALVQMIAGGHPIPFFGPRAVRARTQSLRKS